MTSKLLATALYYSDVLYADQDILNFVLFNRWLRIDVRYNVQAHYNFTFLPLVTESPWIIHYITDRKPWIPEYKDETIFSFSVTIIIRIYLAKYSRVLFI